MKIKVLLADDHKLFRDGLSTLLNKQPDMKVVGE
ncbi:MAG TPA: DNA-binding response regulator, partial [candidate division Zixibacteria bacterium]|nr:DNA-binding response regulator [candidate division Zixibacteria bacterium]